MSICSPQFSRHPPSSFCSQEAPVAGLHLIIIIFIYLLLLLLILLSLTCWPLPLGPELVDPAPPIITPHWTLLPLVRQSVHHLLGCSLSEYFKMSISYPANFKDTHFDKLPRAPRSFESDLIKFSGKVWASRTASFREAFKKKPHFFVTNVTNQGGGSGDPFVTKK